MIRLPYREIEKGTYHSFGVQFLEECKVFERPPRKKYALKYAEVLGLDPWPFWEIVKQMIGDPKE